MKQRFEHCHVKVIDSIEEVLKSWEYDGWELAGMLTTATFFGATIMVFKRPIEKLPMHM